MAGCIPYDDVVTEAMVRGLPITAFEYGEVKHVWRHVHDWLAR